MVAVEARSRVREQSELAETGRFADAVHCSIFLIHLGVSYAQHKVVSRRLWLSKAAHRAGLFQMVLLVGCVAAVCICQTGAGRVSQCCMRVSLGHNAKDYNWSRAKERCCLCTLRSGRGSNRWAGVQWLNLPFGKTARCKYAVQMPIEGTIDGANGRSRHKGHCRAVVAATMGPSAVEAEG